jgi:hypothetical protein
MQNLEQRYLEPDKRIKWARKYYDKLMLHVHGVGLDCALAKINNYENDAQKEARDKFAISNKFITDRLLRPTDNVFSAKGGYKKYHFETGQEENERKFVDDLVDVYSGYSLSQYIHRVWFDKYIVDPNGLIFLEVSEDGDKIYPTYKSIYSIRNYAQNGINVDWVVFEPHEKIMPENKDEEEKELFWAVDEIAYYLCIKDDKGVRVLSSKEHNFKQVPARLCSDIEDHVTGWKKSLIDSQIELLNKFMIDTSVLTIVDFFHSYPQMWTYVDECKRCNGTGEITNGVQDGDGNVNNTCPVCGGTGKASRKDVTEILELRVPDKEEQKIDPPMGYVYMPPEAEEIMKGAVDRGWNMIMFSLWGTSLEYGKVDGNQYATATGRWIDTQPVNNKLNRVTESVQLMHNSLVDLYGGFYFPETYTRSEIIYGRRYMLETPDQLLKRYGDLINLTENSIMADVTWEQYLESEFKDNDQLYIYNKKLSALDPFPHLTVETVMGLNMPNLLKRKMFVIDYKNSREVNYIITTPLKELRVDYDKYLETVESVVQPKTNKDE